MLRIVIETNHAILSKARHGVELEVHRETIAGRSTQTGIMPDAM